MIDKVKVGCFTYEIKITSDPIIVDNKSDYTGLVDYHKNEIRIKSELSEDNQIEILFHELMHAIKNYFELDFEKDNEEKIIDCFAKGIYQILKDNENLIE